MRTGNRPLTRVMHRVGTRYGRYFNDRYGRVGYLFQGRYRAIAIEHDEYLTTLVRYVHRNPLRAGLVATIGDLDRYRWTGHAALVGRAPAARFHDAQATLRLFSECDSSARDSLRELMRSEPDPPPAQHTTSESTASHVAARDPSPPPAAVPAPSFATPADAMSDLIVRVCAARRVPEGELRSGSRRRPVSLARAIVAYLAFHDRGVSLAEVARYLGVSRQSLWERLEDGRRAAILENLTNSKNLTPGSD